MLKLCFKRKVYHIVSKSNLSLLVEVVEVVEVAVIVFIDLFLLYQSQYKSLTTRSTRCC